MDYWHKYWINSSKVEQKESKSNKNLLKSEFLSNFLIQVTEIYVARIIGCEQIEHVSYYDT